MEGNKEVKQDRNNKIKYFVVADVHGFYSELRSSLKRQGFSIKNNSHKLILCGDGFDRGSESIEMQDFLLKLLGLNRLIYIRGNHEDLVLEFIKNFDYYTQSKSFLEHTHHFANGTIDTLLQLTGISLSEAIRSPKRFLTAIKNTPYVNKLIPATKNYYELGETIFVHGWLPCKVRGNNYSGKKYEYRSDWKRANRFDWDKARWHNGMDAWAQGAYKKGTTIVCGHFHSSYGHHKYGKSKSEWGKGATFTPFNRIGINAIDGCTAISGIVNCIVIEDNE